MKVIGFYILHYGKEYLDASLRSIENFCDKIIIFYSPTPSQGYGTDLVCPDTREELKAIADKHPKVEGKDITAYTEGEHTSLIFQYANGYDALLRADADEIFDQEDLAKALKIVETHDARYFGVNGFKHLWKSFDKVLVDWFQPVRICKPAVAEGKNAIIDCRVYHFGYCQDIKTIEYKISVSGHKSEWRPEWLELYRDWTPDKKWLHPTSKTIWEHPEPFDKNTMPDFMKSHPNFNKESV